MQITIDPLTNELILLKPAIIFPTDGSEDKEDWRDRTLPASLLLMTL